jgi:broad specificity phosphatase PhoE
MRRLARLLRQIADRLDPSPPAVEGVVVTHTGTLRSGAMNANSITYEGWRPE